jgi:hypothetical protein
VDDAAVDAWLAEYQIGFAKLAAAQQRRACVFETGIGITALFPHAQAAREVVRVVAWRTRRDLARGDIERPIRDVAMILRLSRDLQPRGGMICQLVSVAVDNMCCQTIVPEILRADGIEERHCDRLLNSLDQHEVGSRLRFRRAMEAEYVMARKALHDFQHHTGDISSQVMKEMGVTGMTDSPFAYLQIMMSLGIAGEGRLAKEKYGQGAAGLTPDHPLVVGWAVDGKLMSEVDYAEEVAMMNRVYAAILKTTDETTLQRLHAARDATIVEPLRDTEVALLFEPANRERLVLALLRAETMLAGTKCLVALRRWQLGHDSPPPDLETLVRTAGLAGVPTDPYSDQPMRMTKLDQRTVIYSVGLDGKDDRARAQWDLNPTNPTGDLVFSGPHQ